MTQAMDVLLARRVLDSETGCWLYNGPRSGIVRHRYGQVSAHDPDTGVNYTERAHRISWVHYRGAVPEGMHLDHTCMVKACFNPDHLRVVSPRLNSIENSTSVAAIHAAKVDCPKCGGRYAKVFRGGRWVRTCTPCHKAYRYEWVRRPENRARHAELEKIARVRRLERAKDI